jgi:hypothetical protein
VKYSDGFLRYCDGGGGEYPPANAAGAMFAPGIIIAPIAIANPAISLILKFFCIRSY